MSHPKLFSSLFLFSSFSVVVVFAVSKTALLNTASIPRFELQLPRRTPAGSALSRQHKHSSTGLLYLVPRSAAWSYMTTHLHAQPMGHHRADWTLLWPSHCGQSSVS
ncbi:hypothetical protein V8C42DRAFT_313815 [Trichoderma barbatum]